MHITYQSITSMHYNQPIAIHGYHSFTPIIPYNNILNASLVHSLILHIYYIYALVRWG